MKIWTREEMYDLQRKHGEPEHSHLNGLMSCVQCINLVINGERLEITNEKMLKRMFPEFYRD